MTNLLEKYEEATAEAEAELSTNIQDIAEIQLHLLDYIRQQNHPLLRIEDNIMRSQTYIETGRKDLEIANSYYFNYTPIIIGGIIGGLTMTPIGIVIGTKLVTLGGVIIGSCTGYHIQKI